MRRSCRRVPAAVQHPADRRAQFLVLAVDAAKPTTRPPLSFQQLGLQSLDVLASRLGLLRPEHPTDPFIAGKRREVLPRRQNLWVGSQDASQVHRDGMHHSAGDHPGAHRSPIVASMRSKVALRSRGAERPPSAGSVDSLGQGHDDSLRPAHVRHAPDVLVLADAAYQAIAVRSQPVDNALEVVHFEANVAQPQLVGHGVGRSGFMVGPDEARQLQPGSSVGRPQRDDLGTRVRYANDGVDELAFHEHPAFDLKTQLDKERRHRVEVPDRDADVVEALNTRHGCPPVLVLPVRFALLPLAYSTLRGCRRWRGMTGDWADVAWLAKARRSSTLDRAAPLGYR